MPLFDLDVVVSSLYLGESEGKITRETLSQPTHGHTAPADCVSAPAMRPPDTPPESYFLDKDAQVEWLSHNAFFDRKDSHRGNLISNLTPNSNSNSNPNLQRILLKPKSSIIGLPKPQKACFNEAKNRRNYRITRRLLIPRRLGSRLKTDSSLSEPSSPKVSCTGEVKSKGGRSRRIRRQKPAGSDPVIDKPSKVEKPGYYASLKAILRAGGGCKDTSGSTRSLHGPATADIRSEGRPDDGGVVSPAIGLGGMHRFVSGRKADLGVDVDVA